MNMVSLAFPEPVNIRTAALVIGEIIDIGSQPCGDRKFPSVADAIVRLIWDFDEVVIPVETQVSITGLRRGIHQHFEIPTGTENLMTGSDSSEEFLRNRCNDLVS